MITLLMNNRIKLEHYVPQCYLSSFVIKPKKHSIHCFDKTKPRSFVVNIRNVASERSFYDVPDDPQQTVEKVLANIESCFKSVHRKILDHRKLDLLTAEDRMSLASFVVSQELRTREHREAIKDTARQVRERLSKEKLTDEFKARYNMDSLETEEGAKAMHLGFLKRIPLYADILLQMRWLLFVNRTPIPLWTSDQPINRYNPVDARPRGNLGLLCKGIELHFPLSPQMVLVFTDPILSQPLPNEYEIDDVQNIMFENLLQVVNSTRYVFSRSDDFSFALEILKKNPSVGLLDRKRMQIS